MRSSPRLVRRLLLASAVIVPLAIVVVLLATTGQSPQKTQIVTSGRPLVNGVVQAARGELPTTTLAAAPSPTAPVPSTTAAPAATTTAPTVRAAATTVSPTTTTRPAKAAAPTAPLPLPPAGTTVTTGPIAPVMVTLASSYSEAVTVTVGGQVHNLAPGQVTAPFSVMPAASGNDIIEIRVTANPGCGLGDAGGYFYSGNSYRLSISGGGGNCLGIVGPNFHVTSLGPTG